MISILGALAAARKGKNQRYTSIKTKLPTEYKTKNLTCVLCGNKYAKRIPISDNEVRILCLDCIKLNQNRDIRHTPVFRRASKI